LKDAGLFTCNRSDRKSEQTAKIQNQRNLMLSFLQQWFDRGKNPSGFEVLYCVEGRGWRVSGVSIRPVPRGDLLVKHSRKSRSITSRVSISSWDGAEFTIVTGRHSCPREIPQRTSALIGGL